MINDRLSEINGTIGIGLALIHAERFDDAISQFESILGSKHPDAYFGLASAKFLKGKSNLSLSEIIEIGNHYQTAIELKPDFADAHYMSGLLFGHIASRLFQKYEQDPYNKANDPASIKKALRIAMHRAEMAANLNPNYGNVVQSDLNRYNDMLVRLYIERKENKAQLN